LTDAIGPPVVNGWFLRRIGMRLWLDRNGRFSVLRATVLAALLLPALVILVDGLTGELGPRIINEIIHRNGLWAIRLLMISLAITPLRRILQWPQLITVRRMVGVAAFAYAAAHLATYILDQGFDLPKVATEIALRLYLTIGLVALVGLAVLAATSTDRMLRRLGGRRWRRLHQSVYAIGVLASIHYFMQSKLALAEPTVLAGLFAWLMGYRIVYWLWGEQRGLSLWMVTALAPAAALLTAISEAIGFWYFIGVPPQLILAADLSFEAGIRPAWIVFGTGMAVAILGLARMLYIRTVLGRTLPAAQS
jgi:sulfoxide reductase heme-binding subunit YedZ